MIKVIIVVLGLLIFSLFDIKFKRIPAALLLICCFFAIGYAIYSLYHHETTISEYGIALFPGVICLLAAFATGNLGVGDGCLFIVLGVVIGPADCIKVFCISMFLAGIASIILLVSKKAGKKTSIPYVPFITAAVVLNSLSACFT